MSLYHVFAVNFLPFSVYSNIIDIRNNQFNQLSQATFRPVIEAMISSGLTPSQSFVRVYNSKSINRWGYDLENVYDWWHIVYSLFTFSLDPIDCDINRGCGSESWLLGNYTLANYIYSDATCGDSAKTPFSSFTRLRCQCPAVASSLLSPCTCKPTGGSNSSTLTFSCANSGLNDTTMASVASLFTPANPVDVMDLSGNVLTRVPPNLPQLFPQVTSLSLANNTITSIGSGQLNVTATVTSLDVSTNKISSIATNALPGLITSSRENTTLCPDDDFLFLWLSRELQQWFDH